MRDETRKYIDVFSGLDDAYAILFYKTNVTNKNGKREGYNIVFTKDEKNNYLDKDGVIQPTFEEAVEGHLTGSGPSVAVFPTTRSNTCGFGCIDIDEYKDLDLQNIIDNIKNLNLPLVLFRSKSGGLHAYLFSKPAVNAATMQDALKNLSSLLGYSNSEIFPKQAELLPSDIGNCLNAPYDNAEKSTRHAYKADGSRATLEEFFALYEEYVQTPDQITALGSYMPSDQSLFEDGPPCLNILTQEGKTIASGNRNNGLFNIGVYLRLRYPDSWETEIYDYNKKVIDPPLNRTEIETLIKSLSGKTYHYKCSDQPICNHCNKEVCLTRRFGVGGDKICTITNLRKYDSEPPLWILDINSKGLELSTDELLDQNRFARASIEQLNILPPTVSRRTWQTTLTELLSQMVEYQQIQAVSPEVSLRGQFNEHLRDFLHSQQSENKEEILLRRPFYDEERKEYVFRLKDLDAHFKRAKFIAYKSLTSISARLRELGGESAQLKLKDNRNIRVWKIPEEDSDTEITAAEFKEEEVPF